MKKILEELWNRPIFNSLHINIWSYAKRGVLVFNEPEIWVSKGRKVKVN